jgi:DNA-binding MarR family transcriptional regulator
VLFDAWLVMHLTIGLLDEALGESGLSADDFGLYSLLAGYGPATPTQLARWTGMRPTTISAALRRMADRGDSDRLPNPEDRRSYLLALSEAGRRRHRAAATAFREVMLRLSATLAPEEREIRLSLHRLDAGLRAIAGLDDRPYTLEAAGPHSASDGSASLHLTYDGRPLTPAEEVDARRYLDWLRANRQPPTS